MDARSGLVTITDVLEISSSDTVLRAGERVSAYAGESVSVSTEDIDVSVGGTITALAGDSASLV
eukprot:SAG31_NODE_39613_length_287_cov_0.606383_1_plen_63_part_01